MPIVDTEIKTLITKDRTPVEIWHRLMTTNAFQSQALPRSLEITLRRSPELKRAFRLFIYESVHGSSPSFPSLDLVLTTFLNRGLFRYQMLWYVLHETRPQLADLVFGTAQSPPQQSHDEQAVGILTAIMDAWRIALRPVSSPFSTSVSDARKDWNSLPTEEELEHTLKNSADYFKRFKELFAGRVSAQLENAVAADSAWAYLCFEDLRKRGSIPDAYLTEWEPWTQLMGLLIAPGRLSHTNYLYRILAKASTEVEKGLVSSAIQRYRADSQPRTITSQLEEPEHPTLRPATIDGQKFLGAAAYRSRLAHAARKGNEQAALNIWYEFVYSIDADRSEEFTSAVIAVFLWYFARSRQPGRAVQAWELLRKLKISPVAEHWTATVEAAKSTGNVASLQSLWQFMLQADARPPNQAWTAYITALFKLKEEGSALKAVAALDTQWSALKKEQVTQPDSLAPSMIPINAAISGLLAQNHVEPIDTLLRLAGQHGLNPSTDTYNIFLKHATQQQDSTKMVKIFDEMKKARCEPDVITFTLVIDSLLRHPDSPLLSSSLTEQEARINQLFTDLATAGLEPNAHTYTTLLSALLDHEDPHISAVQAVLQRMGQQGIRDNSYAYTALVGHHFTRKPPDIAAIERLQQRITDDRLMLDAEFYDRLARGFAEAGEYDRTLSALRKLDARRKLSLRTAVAVLTLLVRSEDFDGARELVTKVQRETVNSPMVKRDRQRLPQWLELVAQLQAAGVVTKQSDPGNVFRKIT
jgi:pentatricopeptide repeat protein